MRWKQVVTVLLAVSMMASMTACGQKEDTSADDVVVEENVSNDSNESEDIVFESELTMGQVDGDVYKSNFMNLSWTLPEGWSFLSEEEMNEINASVLDMLGEDMTLQLEDGGVVCDMQATTENGDNLNVQIEKLSVEEATTIMEKDYADVAVEQISDVFTQIGYSDVITKVTNAVIAGQEHVMIEVTCTYEDVDVCQKLGLIKVDDYMCVITGFSSDMTTVDNMFANFEAL